MVVLNWKGGLGNVTLSPTNGILVPFQTSLASLQPFPIPALTDAQPDEYGIYFLVKKYDPVTGEVEFRKDSDGFKIPYGYTIYQTTDTASAPGTTDDYLIAIGYPPGTLPGGTYSNALNLTTIRLGDGNDVFTLRGSGITQSLSAVVSKEASQGYIFQSNILAGAGDDYVQALMPWQSVFKGGINTIYFDAVFAPGSTGTGVTLSDDLTLEEIRFGDTIELKGSRFDWDIEFKDGNGDGKVSLDSILDERDYIAVANNNQISGFERILFGDILFDLILYRQQQSSAVYGQPEYYLNGLESLAPELNSDITSGSKLWEAFRFNRTKLQGITGTATDQTVVFTGDTNDTPFIVGALQFASLNTEAGNDIVEIGSVDQAVVDLGSGKVDPITGVASGVDLSTALNQLKVNGSVTRSSIDGGAGKDNIIVNSISNSAVNGGAGDDVIQVITSTSQTQFDGGVGSSDALLLPGTFASSGLTSSTSGGTTTFNDVFGNSFVGFESIKFSDINLAPLQQLTLTPAAATVNEGTTATYAIALRGTGLQSGQSVAFSLQLVDGTAQFLSDLASISASSLLASAGIVLSNISVDATAGLIKAVATTSKAFSANATIATLALPIKEDLLAESAEIFDITLRDFTQSQTVTTTISDVAPVSITLTGAAVVTEGQSAAYTVGLNGVGLAAGRSVTFTVDSGGGTATEGTDFSALLESNLVPSTGISLSGKSTDPATKAVTVTATNISGAALTIGAPLLTFQLPITVDSIVEGRETFGVTLASSTALIGNGLVTTTINDLVPTPTVGLSGVVTVAEGQAAAYAVSLLGGGFLAGQSLTLTLDTAGATATKGVDFAGLLAGDLKAAAGISLSGISTDPITKAVTVTATNSGGAALTIGSQLLTFAVAATADAIAEVNETYTVSLTSGTATVSAGTVTTTINSSGGLISANTTAAQWSELNGGSTTFSGIVGTEVAPITVSTGPGNDLVKLDDAIAFATIETGLGDDSIDVIVPDTRDELTRPYVQFGQGAYKAIISTGGGNDRINIQSAENTKYRRSTPQDPPSYNQPDYYDSIVDAGSGNDYVYGFLPYKTQFLGGAGVDTLFLYGRYSDWAHQTVDANGGGLDLTLSDNANDYTIWNASTSISNTAIENRVQGFEFIQFNDIKLDLNENLLLSATTAAYNEGSTATYSIALNGNGLQPGQSVAFTLQLSNGSAQFSSDLSPLVLSSLQASAGIVLSNVTADATTGLIRAVASSTAVLPTGTTIATLSLPIKADLLAEGNEAFGVNLRGFVAPQTVTTTINDVAPVSITLTGPGTVTEGQSASYTVALNGVGLAAGSSVTFTIDSGSGTATEGTDFSALLESNLVPSTGISLSGKSTDPATKAVTVTATNISGAALTIGAPLLTFQLPITVDSIVEGRETFGVTLASSTALIGNGLVTTTINDLVPTPTVGLSGVVTVAEGQAAAYAVSLLGGGFLAGQSLTLTLDTAGATATKGVDFAGLLAGDLKAAAGISLSGISTDPITKAVTVTATNSSGQTLAAGSQLLTFAIQTTQDTLNEGDENFAVTITAASDATVANAAPFLTTIADDDQPIIRLSGSSKVGEPGTASYSVRLAAADILAIGQALTFVLGTTSATATEELDFFPLLASAIKASKGLTLLSPSTDPNSQAVTVTVRNDSGVALPGGSELVSFTVMTRGDFMPESDETFLVNLTSATGPLGDATVTTTIQDDDEVVLKLAGSVGVVEGSRASYGVYLDGRGLGNGRKVTLTIDATGITATEGVDFLKQLLAAQLTAAAGLTLTVSLPTRTPQTVTVTNTSGSDLAPGSALLSFSIPTTVDLTSEGNETFAVNIISSTAMISSGTVTTAISDYGTTPSNPGFIVNTPGTSTATPSGAAKPKSILGTEFGTVEFETEDKSGSYAAKSSLAKVTASVPLRQEAIALLNRYQVSGSSGSRPASDPSTTVLQLNLNVGSTGYDRLADITLATEVNATASLHINSATGVAKDNTYDPNTGLGVELLDTNNNNLVDTLRVHLQDGASGDDDGSSNGRIQTSLLLANAPRSTVYRFYNQRSGVHFYTPDEGERDNVILNSYGAGTSYEKLKANPASIDPLTGGWGYTFEGIAYQALETQGTALYRFYNASKGYHFLSTSAEEANNVIKNSLGAGFDLNNAINKDPITGGWGYKYEGTTYKVSTIAQHGMDQAVYRFYNVNKGVHFYTASSDERDNVIRNSVGGSYVGQLDQARNAALLNSGWGYRYEGIGWYV